MNDSLRELCIRLLGEMPNDALFETYETLVQIGEFYTEASVYVSEPPKALPSRKAIVLPATTRIDYPFDPDDCN